MDNLPNNQPSPLYKRKILWIYLLVLLLIPVSFYIYKNYVAKTPNLPQLILPEQAMKSIYDLSKTSLTPKTATSSFDIKKTDDPQRLSASWETADNILVNISARYNQQGNVDEKNMLVTLPDPINNLTVTSTPTLATIYLAIQAKGSWKCDTQASLCENFWIEQDVKKGLGVSSLTPNEKGGSVFYCEIYPGSPVYQLKKSCNSGIIK